MSGGAGGAAPRLSPATRAEWRAWLAANHDDSTGVLLVVQKKRSALPGVGYDEAVEEALCFGWIDSRVRRLDEDRFEQWYCPRRRGSIWSQSNKERVERLKRAGLMARAGLARVETAMGDGSWGLLDEIEAMVVPADPGGGSGGGRQRGRFRGTPRIHTQAGALLGFDGPPPSDEGPADHGRGGGRRAGANPPGAAVASLALRIRGVVHLPVVEAAQEPQVREAG